MMDKHNVEVFEFKGRKKSMVQRKDKQGNLFLCPSDARDMSECVGENIVDMTYARGG